MKVIGLVFLFSASVILVCSPAIADEVTLKNNNVITGKIISESDDEIVIQVGASGTVTIRRSDVKDIERRPVEDNTIELEEENDSLINPAVYRWISLARAFPRGHPIRSFFEKLLALYFGLLLLGLVLVVAAASMWMWLAIKVVDSNNPRNTYLISLFWNSLRMGIGLALSAVLGNLLVNPLSLIGFIVILVAYYHLGLLKTIVTIIVTYILAIASFILIFLVLVAVANMPAS
jgi:hypothetical protein